MEKARLSLVFGENMVPDGKEFLSEGALRLILKSLGWDYSESFRDICSNEHNLVGEVLPLRADFYPVGWKLAFSNKATISCDGVFTSITYKGENFISPWEIYDRFGADSLNDMENWIFKEEKEWLIKKLDGSWIGTFTYLTECPFRTKVRC
tara:strand:+ start:320 stop:772 length:453 start_codon:yes stop_codon:yes gene_type:complete